MTTTLAYPAVGLSGARSGITHAARPGQDETVDGWARSFCGRWVSIDHRLDGAPLQATADVMVETDDDLGVVLQPIDCAVCRAGIEAS